MLRLDTHEGTRILAVDWSKWDAKWDKPVSPELQRLRRELTARNTWHVGSLGRYLGLYYPLHRRIEMAITERSSNFCRVLEHEIGHTIILENLTDDELRQLSINPDNGSCESRTSERLADAAAEYFHCEERNSVHTRTAVAHAFARALEQKHPVS